MTKKSTWDYVTGNKEIKDSVTERIFRKLERLGEKKNFIMVNNKIMLSDVRRNRNLIARIEKKEEELTKQLNDRK